MRNSVLIFTATLLLVGCTSISVEKPVTPQPSESARVSPQSSQMELSKEQQYFLEIALGTEFGKKNPVLRRWEEPLAVYVDGKVPDVLERELMSVMDEILALAPNLSIHRVYTLKEANVVVFFGPYKAYAASYAPDSIELLSNNWGLFTARWKALKVKAGIQTANMYVDTNRARDSDARRHLLREEFTQLLGLMADSYKYPSSIFYQPWSTVTEYSTVDRALIKMLYDKRLESGMRREDIIEAWQNSSETAEPATSSYIQP